MKFPFLGSFWTLNYFYYFHTALNQNACYFSKSCDKLSVGIACKGLLLQLPIPLKIKKRLRDRLPAIQENHLWGQVLDFKSLTVKVSKHITIVQLVIVLSRYSLQNKIACYSVH